MRRAKCTNEYDTWLYCMSDVYICDICNRDRDRQREREREREDRERERARETEREGRREGGRGRREGISGFNVLIAVAFVTPPHHPQYNTTAKKTAYSNASILHVQDGLRFRV